MKKLPGGRLFYWTAHLAPIRLHEEHLDAIRSGEMADEWYAGIADACWESARAREIERLKLLLRVEAGEQLRVVDRRPKRLAIVGGGA